MEQDGLSLDELRLTAELAHITLTGAELQAALRAAGDMLSYFAAMQEAGHDPDMAGGSPESAAAAPGVTRQRAGTEHFRADAPLSMNAAEPEALLKRAGERDGSFIVMPNVL